MSRKSMRVLMPDMIRWMPGNIVAESWALEDQLLEIWTKYLQAIGPSIIAAYRTNKLMELPHVHAFNRVQDQMQQIAQELLVEEEILQDDHEKASERGG